MEYPSAAFEEAVNEFLKLPGIGRKTAARLVIHLLKREPAEVEQFGHVLRNFPSRIKTCRICRNITDHEICTICSNSNRDNQLICVVEDIRDLIAIENTQQYAGTYHVLGGLIAPMDGIGPADLNIESLMQRIAENERTELVFALSSTMEGDTTMFYISKQCRDLNVRLSNIARGIAVGGELEYADEVTLGRSIATRTPLDL